MSAWASHGYHLESSLCRKAGGSGGAPAGPKGPWGWDGGSPGVTLPLRRPSTWELVTLLVVQVERNHQPGVKAILGVKVGLESMVGPWSNKLKAGRGGR